MIVTTTPDAVRVPMAQAGMALLLACAHRLVENHRVVTTGSWAEERGQHRGTGLPGRMIGIVGLGNVGSLLASYIRHLGGNVVASGRGGSQSRAAETGTPFVDLMTLASMSDFVVICTSLTRDTRGLIGYHFLTRMPSHSYLVNIARGGVLDQQALVSALQSESIAGCALDVLDGEPPDPGDPLLHMENVILSPHALCWTEQFTNDVWSSVIKAILTASSGDIPADALAQDHLDSKTWRGAAGREGNTE